MMVQCLGDPMLPPIITNLTTFAIARSQSHGGFPEDTPLSHS